MRTDRTTAACAPRARGFTLVELLVTGAILAIVLVAVFGVVQGQQNAFFEGNLQRGAQGSARSALAFLEQRLATAGFGMDASLAFDFRSAVAPCPALAAPCARDRIDGNDELVFFSRNPRYWVPDNFLAEPVGNAWRIISIVGNIVTVNARPGDAFVPGRILQAVCKGGERYAYFTVAASAAIPEAGPAAALPITVANATPADPFSRPDQATHACFSSGEARLFRIDRFRFHVRPVRTGTGIVPYLVLDPGLDANGDGPDDAEEIVVAEGIESFQVGYVMSSGALVPRGTTAGAAIVFNPGFPGTGSANAITTLAFPGAITDPSQSEYVWTSWYAYSVGPPATAPERLTDHQANIRALRISLVARGAEPDPARPRADPFTPVLNASARPAWVDPGVPYNRVRLDATYPLRNMTTRAMLDH